MVNPRVRINRHLQNAVKVFLLVAVGLTFGLFYLSSLQTQSTSYEESSLTLASSTHSCRAIHHAQDQCTYYHKYCDGEDDGIFPYLELYYCRLSGTRPLAMVIILAWLAILFTALGLVAGDFLSVNLGSIASFLHISDTLAGVTFLAIGNGSPDIFSTFAAMKSGTSGMAVGELLGAAAFITTVVAGSMALVKPFDVARVSLFRDGLFLMVAVAFLIYILSDGHLRLWHCIVMLSMYIVYVSFVVGWHWWRSHPSRATKRNERLNSLDEEGSVQQPTEATSLLQNGHIKNRNDQAHNQPRSTGTRSGGGSQSQMDTISSTSSEDGRQCEPGSVYEILFPGLHQSESRNTLLTTFNIISAPIMLALRLTVPVIEHVSDADIADGNDQPSQDWCRWLCIAQCFLSPQMALLIVSHQMEAKLAAMVLPVLICLGISAALAVVVLLSSSQQHKPRWYNFLSIPGFIMGILWISTIADEAVSVLKALGIICNISGELLGITAFAIGNSLDDLAVNVSVARHKHPVMALSACFGGPLLNILLGISVSGIYLFSKNLHTHGQLKEITLKGDRSLFIEAGMVLFTIAAVLCAMAWTKWRFTRVLGLLLIAVWVIGTVVNVILTVA